MIRVLTLLAVLVTARPITAQSLRDAAREQARKSPGVLILLTSAPGDYLPQTIEDLTKESEVKVPGTVMAPPILTVFGGDVTVDGVLIHATDSNREAITDGERYLLFLMNSRRREPGRYEIYHGGVLEVVRNQARPLLRDSERVFKGIVGTPISELIPRIEKAAQSR